MKAILVFFILVIAAINYSSAEEDVAVNSARVVEPRLQRDCMQIGNRSGRDFTQHLCPLRWYVAGLQFVGHQNGESAYLITCCQDI